ncbi:unnamed protein product, partial [Vitis vinifera]|uniref:Uncharacterized protein n=1 Tax=Vitis vinifera TaxID=29760 RepID=D7TUT9_VITVI
MTNMNHACCPRCSTNNARNSALLLFISSSVPLEEIRPIHPVLVPSPDSEPCSF